MIIPRPEHPNPQLERKNWLNLNGEWDFEFDFGNSKKAAGILEKKDWDKKIIVPFCPESKLSGIEYTDFIPAVWYRRNINISEENLNGKVFINFGAVDYEATVYVNGKKAGYHKGGYSSFRFDITDLLVAGENTIIVNAVDDVRSTLVPRGKQCEELHSRGCDYTRTTGIWQTVWLEFTPAQYIKNFRLYPDAENACLAISANVEGEGEFVAEAFYDGKSVGIMKKKASDSVCGEISLSESHLWEPGCGRLYDLKLSFNGDEISSYFGLRSVKLDDYKFLINGKSVFQRLVLDQGFYRDGIYTAPTEADLIKDIEISYAVGFNGARLHQKVFEPRFLYHADKLGYMVWAEAGNWGFDHTKFENLQNFLPEWLEEVERDFSHPSVIGWCPFNETWDQNGHPQSVELLDTIYDITKAIDSTRPVITSSGSFPTKRTDVHDVHDYEQDPVKFTDYYAHIPEGKVIAIPADNMVLYYIDPSDGGFAALGLNYTTGNTETNLIGVHKEGVYGRVSGDTHAVMGMTLFAEYLDGIAVVSFGA